jgi:hypothetical protein
MIDLIPINYSLYPPIVFHKSFGCTECDRKGPTSCRIMDHDDQFFTEIITEIKKKGQSRWYNGWQSKSPLRIATDWRMFPTRSLWLWLVHQPAEYGCRRWRCLYPVRSRGQVLAASRCGWIRNIPLMTLFELYGDCPPLPEFEVRQTNEWSKRKWKRLNQAVNKCVTGYLWIASLYLWQSFRATMIASTIHYFQLKVQ